MTKVAAIFRGMVFYLTWACLIAGTWAILALALKARLCGLKD